MARFREKPQEEESGLQEHVVNIYRCAKVVKGGRRFSFSALVVVGDGRGQVGVGYGKANEVPPAVEKGKKNAAANMEPIALEGTTIPHRVEGFFGASKVVLVPAGAGTGVIAGASVRAVLEAAGVHDVLTKAYGSTSPKNLVKATMRGLRQLRTHQAVQALRNVNVPMDETRRARIKHGEALKAAEAEARERAEQAKRLAEAPPAETPEPESQPAEAPPEPAAASLPAAPPADTATDLEAPPVPADEPASPESPDHPSAARGPGPEGPSD